MIKFFEDYSQENEDFVYTIGELGDLMRLKLTDLTITPEEMLETLEANEPFLVLLPNGDKISWDTFVTTFYFSDIMNGINEERLTQ